MPNLRLFLFLALFLLGFQLWQQWQLDYGPKQAPEQVGETQPQDAALIPDSIPDAPVAPSSDQVPNISVPATNSTVDAANDVDRIEVITDTLALTISTKGGDIVSGELLDYPLVLKQPEAKIQLFDDRANSFYVAQSGLVSGSGSAPDHKQIFRAEQLQYHLGEGSDELSIPLVWIGDNGLKVTKTYKFKRGSYQIEVEQNIENGTGQAWVGSQYRQLQRVEPPELEGNAYSNPSRFSFSGAAVYSTQEKYEKFEYKDIGKKTVERKSDQAWIAMVQHYFLTAWVPAADEVTTISTQALPTSPVRYLVRSVSPSVQVEPGATLSLNSTLFVGPKLQDDLRALSSELTLTVDYGIFTPFSKILFWVMDKIHNLVGNWGIAIVLLTVLVKAAFFKLTEKQYRSMAKMRKLTPRIQALKERYGDDRQKFNMAMMEFYKKEKVNPLGGCLPVLVQIPVFFALYWVLVETVELRQAPFMLWIQDLSSPDPYFVLPLINGIAMFFTTKLSPNPAADPIQQKIFLAMPVVFSIMFAFFQSGLVLYWATNAVLSLAQQWYITRSIERSP